MDIAVEFLWKYWNNSLPSYSNCVVLEKDLNFLPLFTLFVFSHVVKQEIFPIFQMLLIRPLLLLWLLLPQFYLFAHLFLLFLRSIRKMPFSYTSLSLPSLAFPLSAFFPFLGADFSCQFWLKEPLFKFVEDLDQLVDIFIFKGHPYIVRKTYI